MPVLDFATAPVWVLAAIAVVMFIGGFVRGYTGFGGPAIVIIALTYFFAPVSVAGKVLVVDTIANVQMLRSTWREANWRQNGVLIGATLLGTPVGVWVLSRLDDALMQQVIAVMSLICAALMLTGWRFKRQPNSALLIAAGFFGGILMAATGIALLMMTFLFLLPGSAAVSRANAVQWLMIMNLLLISQYVYAGLLTPDEMWRAALIGLVYLGGTLLGSSLFRASKDATVRRAAVWLVFALALMGLTRSL